MPYTYLNDYTLTNVTPVEEVITVAEAKQYCRVTNDVEDDLFVDLISQSREAVEKAANISIIPKTAIVWFNNEAGRFELPFGPVTLESVKVYDDNQDGIEIPALTLRIIGSEYPKIAFPFYANLRAEYETGYTTCPTELKIAMLDQINYGYENRGMDVDDMGICEKTWRVCQRWTRTSPIL
jgi:uncharacterized phiE125 gp8 family phage protein